MTVKTYEIEEDILTLVNKPRTVDSMAIGNIIFDYDKNDNIIAIEIMNATKFFRSFSLSKTDLKMVKNAELTTIKSQEWSENKQINWHHIIIILELKDKKIKIEKEICIPCAGLCAKESKNIEFDWYDFEDAVEVLYHKLKLNKDLKYIYSIPRGGCVLGVRLSHLLDLKIIDKETFISEEFNLLNHQILICDDISDKGDTLSKFKKRNVKIATLHYRPTSKVEPDYYAIKIKQGDMRWVNYPWEAKIKGDKK